MVLDNSVAPYLEGGKFSNNLMVKVATKQPVIDRITYLSNYAKDKKIIHVGCVDHIPLIEDKIKHNTWLYKRLEEVAKKQFGIDNSVEGIRYMQKELKYDNVAVEDILEGPINEIIKKENWDCMILGEILEHIDNPVLFLSKIKDRYSPYVKQLIITVPNALAITNVVQSFKNREQINSDHRYWFSPYTLSKIAIRAGLKPVNHEFATYYSLNNGRNKFKKMILRFILKQAPALRSDLIMIVNF